MRLGNWSTTDVCMRGRFIDTITCLLEEGTLCQYNVMGSGSACFMFLFLALFSYALQDSWVYINDRLLFTVRVNGMTCYADTYFNNSIILDYDSFSHNVGSV